MSVYIKGSGGPYYYDFHVDGVRYSGNTHTEDLQAALERERAARADATGLSSFCRSIVRKAKRTYGLRRNMRGYVYMLRSGYFIKIGHSLNPTERLQKISTACPEDCELLFCIPGDLKLERELHEQFDACHYRREWFFLCGKLKQFIAEFEREKAMMQAVEQTSPPILSPAA